ncbi:MAG: phytanoyl-CoA dioxygenase family protein [Alphaproteobacteria bacterium]|nr:phytanoyl-CoA dioxygenase family protein [Alphaproteobacteria bacterium]
MKLTQAQRDQYDRDGFLIFPDLFSAEEVAILRREVARVSAIESELVVREGAVRAPKILFRVHETDGATASPAFRAATRTPRALAVAQQVLGDDQLYIHHTKVNVKTAIEGSVWPWHQDYGAWMRDGIQSPDMTTVMIALDDATEFNGCLYFLPGSHRHGRSDPYLDTSTAYKVWSLKPDEMKALLRSSPPPVPVTGRAGMAAIFHCNLMHASGHNLSATDRWQAYLCYNTCANRPMDVENPRPDYVRSRNWTPLTLAADDAIRASAAVTA